MPTRDTDRFRPRIGRLRAKGRGGHSPFAKRVLTEIAEAGPASGSGLLKRSSRKGARFGRGHVAARFAGESLGARARRVVIKSRIVAFGGHGRQSTLDYERNYIQRDGVSRDGGRGRLYSAATEDADAAAFADRCAEDRHQFRFIVSAEDSSELGDLKSYTRDLMAQMERDLGTRLDWVAVDHWDTDNPHTHILLRGKDERGRDLVIARDYISSGMRARAAEIATEWLGPRTEVEIRQSLMREVAQERWTSLDRTIQLRSREGMLDLRHAPSGSQGLFQRSLLIGRLDRLASMGLAQKVEPGIWRTAPEAENTLRAMGERGDIIRTLQRAFSGHERELNIFDPKQIGAKVIGRVAVKGYVDELNERSYLIVDGVDGRAHYVALPPKADLAEFERGSIVVVRGGADPRPADRIIEAVAQDGLYRTERHLVTARQSSRNADEFIQAHVRRLEALRRAGIVERVEEGVWRVPKDLVERGRAYDARRADGAIVAVDSPLTIKQQVRAIGATWLDRQLVSAPEVLAHKGFGAEAREALAERQMFLVEQKLAERQGQRVIFARNLLATLRSRDLGQAARSIETETGLVHRPTTHGKPITGVYRRTLSLASGRFAMLDDGIGFSLVPWRPFIQKRLGTSVTAIVRDDAVSWEFGKVRDVGR